MRAPQEKLKTKAMQNFGGSKHDVLWGVCKWRIRQDRGGSNQDGEKKVRK